MPYKSREEQNAYAAKWIRKRRAAWFMGRSCSKCGSDQHLELDHIDPTQKVSHRIWSWALERMQSELAKCQVLCRDCHLVKTVAAFPDRQHGTNHKYLRDKCRCQACKDAHRDVNRKYRLLAGERHPRHSEITGRWPPTP